MAYPVLNPISTVSRIVLPETGTYSDVANHLPFGIYGSNDSPLYSTDFISGAVDQVSYTYKKLGGDVLDIEITSGNVYAAYEEAALEYSYIVNLHQAKNALSRMLGGSTASFDSNGNILSGSALSGSNVALLYPRFDIGYAGRVADSVADETGVGQGERIYSASFATSGSNGKNQDYDLQDVIYSASLDPKSEFYGKIGTERVMIRKVFYKTPSAMWRFFGFYGGMNVVGNMSSYGMFSDDSTFEVIPVWQNKLQAMAYEDAIMTRCSHYSYQLRNNRLRLFPAAASYGPDRIYFEFSIRRNAWESDSADSTTTGINNTSTLPFQNLPYSAINSMGKQWVRRFALALSKETLGQIRGKFATLPIPNSSVTLNHAELLSQAKDEQKSLRDELKQILSELTYEKLVESDAKIQENTQKSLDKYPLAIFCG